MKCPHCRGEISMIAEICPHCRSDLSAYFSEHGADISEIQPLLKFMVKWVFHTFMLYIPFLILVAVTIGDMPEFLWWSAFFVCVVVALIYREKLPIF